MADQNCWNGTGRLCQDPELKYTPSGVALANLRLACNRTKERDGQKADFISLTVWRQAAEFAANHLTKGAHIAITGRLEIRQWAAQDGTKRTTPEIQVEHLYSLGKTVANPDRPHDAPPPTELVDEDFIDPFADQ